MQLQNVLQIGGLAVVCQFDVEGLGGLIVVVVMHQLNAVRAKAVPFFQCVNAGTIVPHNAVERRVPGRLEFFSPPHHGF